MRKVSKFLVLMLIVLATAALAPQFVGGCGFAGTLSNPC